MDLPLGVPGRLPLDIAVGVLGGYSAIGDLVDAQVDLVAGSVPMAVLVADPLPMDGTPLHYRRPSPRPGNSLFHVEVPPGTTARSEEHTSELQSLMRISYAVFCLKKKKEVTKHCTTVNNKKAYHTKRTIPNQQLH